MSVLIKGMKVPTEGKVMTIYKLKGKFYASLNGTELCPLIELPDHGDLIDRDKVWVRTMDYCDLEEAILKAPAVIPAERSEDE